MKWNKKEILIGSLMFILSIAVTVIVVEIGFTFFSTPEYRRARYQNYFDVLQWDQSRTQFDPLLGFITRSNLDFAFRNDEFSTTFRTNSEGYRDDEASLDHPKILLFGDSFGIGWGVEAEDTAATWIEEKTGKRVLNMSVSGYGTVQQFLLLQRYCEIEGATGCETVFLYYMNDRLENRAPPGGMFPALVKKGGSIYFTEPVEEAVNDCIRSNSQNFTTFLCRHSAVLDLVLSRYAHPRKNWQKRMYIEYVENQKENLSPYGTPLGEIEIFEYTVRLIRRLGEENGFRSRFVFLPFYGYYLGDNKNRPYAEEERVLRDLEVPFINPLERFTASDYYDLDGHFKPSGQRKLGEVVAEFLASDPRIPDTSSEIQGL